MKFVINESKLNEIIWKYLDDNFPDLDYSNYIDENGDDDECAKIFHRGSFLDGDNIFRYYNKCWWKTDTYKGLEMLEKSPIIIFENSNEFISLESYFGDLWIPVFKKWFMKTFDLPVKTIEG